MRDKYLEYGPGKDIDPEEEKRFIESTDLIDVEHYAEMFQALQQREERKEKALEEIERARHDMHTGRYGTALFRLEETWKILEGTDGE